MNGKTKTAAMLDLMSGLQNIEYPIVRYISLYSKEISILVQANIYGLFVRRV